MHTKRQFLPSIILLTLLLAFATTTVFAATIMTTMRTDRAVKAGADECYRTVTNITAGETVKLLGRNQSGSWVFIWADVGDGWVPASSVNVSADEVATLSVWTDHFDGEACSSQPPQVDSRICGRPGDDRAATTIRWTDIYESADPDLPTGRSYPPATDLTLTGRDFWGCFVRVRSTTSNGNGWIPVQAIDTRAIMSLPVLVDNSGGCQIVNGQITGCSTSEENTQGDIRTVRGVTTIYNEPNTSSATKGTVPADGRVRIVSERPGWVRVRSRYGNGYIQVEQLNPPSPEDSQGLMVAGSNLHTEPDTDFATNTFVPQGTQVTILRFSSGWIFISAPQGEGWVPARTVGR